MNFLARVGVPLFVVMFISLTVSLYSDYNRYVQNSLPASDWLTVRDVFVPDAVVGEDFAIYVDRVIHQSFEGEYHVQLRHFPSNTNACTASAKTPYLPEEDLDNPVVWSWWAFPQCADFRPEPGEYRVHTQWDIYTEDSGNKRVESTSNVFTVYETSPETIQKQLELKLEVLEDQVEELEIER